MQLSLRIKPCCRPGPPDSVGAIMLPTRNGAFHLFRLAGINVYLHWSWFLVAVYQISTRPNVYASPIWKVAEYLSLFLIVLTHEFGHALACKQVGGKSDEIILWPFGGIAFGNPPQRPGATLWTIAAGPLVNVAIGIIALPWLMQAFHGGLDYGPDLHRFLCMVALLNFGLLVFNIIPVYPLDGGQILRSLLWFPLGKALSLFVATGVGFIGGAALMAYALLSPPRPSWWLAAIVVFLMMNCWQGFKYARALRKLERLPRHRDFHCPSCHASPPVGAFWGCDKCRGAFDTFSTGGVCPHCGTTYATSMCPDCGTTSPRENWKA